MLRTLLRALLRSRLRLAVRPLTAGAPDLPPTARDVLGGAATATEAITYNRVRVATATAVALYRSGHHLPLTNEQLDDAVHALHFPYSVPTPATRAAIRAALGVLEADPTINVTR
ncbi:hypothetical protein ABZV34_27050 [Streptomyces sp. NPDC005195]|uniref:hypothetical protein n=1 Tax=Streptomyces sp. NPDC005195 TaxID=3154561 RepID=UPI0033B6E834